MIKSKQSGNDFPPLTFNFSSTDCSPENGRGSSSSASALNHTTDLTDLTDPTDLM